MKLKKGIPVIDQGNKLGFWGNKFGGNFVPETLKKHTGMYSDELYVSFNNFILDNPTPPEGFFPEEPLNELVDFWSINSG